ncbi:hypothetical protein AB6D57_06650 [Vibrio splendidus]
MYNPKNLDEFQTLANQIYYCSKKINSIHRGIDADRVDTTIDRLKKDIGVRCYLSRNPGLPISEWESLKAHLYGGLRDSDSAKVVNQAIASSQYFTEKLKDSLYLWLAIYRNCSTSHLVVKEALADDEYLNLSLKLSYEDLPLDSFLPDHFQVPYI